MGLFDLLFRRQPADFVNGSGWTIEVVGELHYQGNLLKQYRRAGGTGHDVTVGAVLTSESSNRFDENAVRVEIGGRVVGYLAGKRAAAYRRAVGTARGACSAKIVGGYAMEDGRRAHFGVKLNLAWPPRFSSNQD